MIPLHGRLWLLGALAAVLLPQLLRLPPWLATCCAGLLGWRLVIDLRSRALPGRWSRLLLTLLGIGAVLLGYRTLFGPDAGLALLSVMLCLKLLELRTLRDAVLVIFLGWFLVAGGFLVDQSIFVGAYLLLTVWLLTAALIALNHPGGPAHRYYLRRAGLLLAQSLPIMVLLFVLFPRLPGPLWGVPKDSLVARTGISDHMTLGTISELAESEAVAFRVQFDGPVPPADQLYWRGPVLWTTDGRRWDPIPREFPPAWFRDAPGYEALGEPVRYALTLESHDEHWLFALELPAALPPGLNLSADFQLLLPRKATTRQRYELAAHTRYRTGALPDEQRRLGLQLPAGRNPRSLALGREWADRAPADIVRTALELFRAQPYWYTRRPPLLGEHAIDDFLFATQRGFCEHYAAAFVTLMRAAGVPARVVTGYQGGESNPLADYLIVRQSHAHAWAEVWLDGQGWTRIDPTAVIPPQRVETEADLQRFRSTATPLLNADLGWITRNLSRLRYGWDALNNAWNQWVLGYNHQRQKELLQRLGLLHFGWQGVVVALFGAMGLVLAAVAVFLLRQGRARTDAVVRLFERYCRKLARIGLRRLPHEGPADFADRVAAARPDLAEASNEVSALYVALRYGAARTETLSRLRDAVARFRPRRRRGSAATAA
ncbi:transglutaminase TgpA family protein [Sulfurivermis fontis]|uniref:transglutaminase TgpA family protein n=1 Tax=Sulfurivermis fontis TaxID=1972068 RepID=UPI000FD86E82|nr:DUF3488 and transglutaminase-like domain-containing protein [Sulfurivermis fontis]